MYMAPDMDMEVNIKIVKEKYPNAEIHAFKFYGGTKDYTVVDGLYGKSLGATGFSESDAWAYAAERIINATYK